MDNMFSNWEDIAELELFMDDFVGETVEANSCNTVAMSNHQERYANEPLAITDHQAATKKRPLVTPSHRGHKRTKSSKNSASSIASQDVHEEETPVRKLLAFPSFDRSDSLIYLPYTLARKLNCGDHDSLRKTLYSYLHRDCAIFMGKPGSHVWRLDLMLQLFEITNDLHPDSVMCVHTCHVVENNITAAMYFKFTDSVQLAEALGASTTDPFFQSIVKRSRGNRLKQRLSLENRPVEEQQQLCSLADSNDDLVIYGKVDLLLTFDIYSKKVTTMVFDAQLTSLARHIPVPENV